MAGPAMEGAPDGTSPDTMTTDPAATPGSDPAQADSPGAGPAMSDVAAAVLAVSETSPAAAAQSPGGPPSDGLPGPLFEVAPVPMLLVSMPEGRVLRANGAAEALYRYERSVLEQLPYHELCAPPDASALAEVEALAGSVKPFASLRHKPRVGGAKDVDVSAQRVRYDGHDCLYLVVRDMTVQRAAQRIMQESVDRFRALEDQAPALLWITEEGHGMIFFSKGWYLFTGRTSEAELGYGWLDHVHPDDRAAVRASEERAYAARDEWEIEYRQLRSDGAYRWMLARGRPRHTTEGEFLGFIGSSVDITDRREAEQALQARERELQAVFQTVRDVIFKTDESGHWTFLNQAFEEITGYSVEDALGEYALEQVYDFDREIIEEEFRPVLTGESEHFYSDLRVVCADGETRWVAVHSRCLRDESGSPVGTAGTMRDVTTAKQLEREMIEARHQALEASRLKSQFVANMSHELRTPMNGVIGLTDLLLDTDLTDEQRDYAETIRGSGEALLSIINDILDFSKIEAGKLDLELIDFDLADVVEGVAGIMAGPAQHKGLALVTDIGNDVPMALKGDPHRVRQIVLNLASNAVKFTTDGEVTIRVRVVRADSSQSMLRFEVQDTGIGIPYEAQSKLFEAFTQADASTTRKFGGTGLGLTISKRLSELMGGTIGLDSKPGQGSTFWFTARFGLIEGVADRFGPARQLLSGQRALVLEQNAATRRSIVSLLEGVGLRCEDYDDGQLAVNAIKEQRQHGDPFRFLLVDRGLPGIDFEPFVKVARVWARRDEFNVVVLSGLGEVAGAEADDIEGVDAVVSKPIRRDKLVGALCGLLGGVEASDALGARVIEAPKLAVAEEDEEGRRPLLLVAEDNPVNRKVAQRLLDRLGYDIEMVVNGVEAVDAYDDHGEVFGAILMDCQMPEMDGYAATGTIRDHEAAAGDGRRVPIIAMTAHAMTGDRERAISAGMDDYVTKPVNRTDLADALARWVRKAVPVD